MSSYQIVPSKRKKDRESWDMYFMKLAINVAERSTCERATVGSVLVRDKRIIATGYNGSVVGEPHCDDAGHLMDHGHCIRTVHSELNAILQCAANGVRTKGAVLYVTHFPCLNCTKALIQAGIVGINYCHDYHNDAYAIHLMQSHHIQVHQIAVASAS
ncbi:deoxycytidylate deaminase [Agrilactobacillus fermenti]|uniref:deoxycytidylate deaminase n=1 Tax=Agrilactobacillus fermenti TaxID=2586909 RepID=UPI001E49A345|nr:deaminase [Agrilactobacillus fermenti]MCD2256117.1 CMP deaminase [Agrilactobacillus fermenti]